MALKNPEDRRAAAAARSMAWRANNREKHRAYSAAYRTAHPEEERACKAAYRAAHPGSNRTASAAWARKWRAQHPEEVRIRSAAYRAAHAEENRARLAAWRAAHPGRNRVSEQRRRARKRGALINDFTTVQWRELQATFDHRCAYCGKRAKGHLTIDHITPLAKGGNHTLTNIVPACRKCNCRKGVGPLLRPVQPMFLIDTGIIPQEKTHL